MLTAETALVEARNVPVFLMGDNAMGRKSIAAALLHAQIEALKELKEIYEEAPVLGIALFDVRDRIEAEIARAAREEP